MNEARLSPLDPTRTGHADPVVGVRELPLTDAQRWVHKFEVAGRFIVQHTVIILRLDGVLDRRALRAALDEVTALHRPLRTVLRERREGVVREIRPWDIGFALLSQEVSDDVHVERIHQEELDKPFDLSAGPMIRGRLLRFSDHKHVLLIMAHRLVFDTWSAVVVLRQMASLYSALRVRDFRRLQLFKAEQENCSGLEGSAVTAQLLRQQLDFWRSALLTMPEATALPTDSDSSTQPELTGRVKLILGHELTTQLEQLDQGPNGTVLAPVLGSWALLLGRWTAQQRLVVVTWLRDGRSPEMTSMIGQFENIAALPIQLDWGMTVAEFLGRVGMIVAAAERNSDVRIEQVLERLHAVHGHSMILPLMLRLHDEPSFDSLAADLRARGLCAGNVSIAHGRVRAQLALRLSRERGTLCGSVDYAAASFDRESVEQLIASWKLLLAGMLADEHQTIGRVPIADCVPVPYQPANLLVERLQDRLLHELIEENAESMPEGIAVTFAGRQLCYQALNERANQLAHFLGEYVAANDLVVVCLQPSIELVVTLLAVLKAGCAYVPMDVSDARSSTESMVDISAPALLLTDTQLQALLRPTGTRVIALDAHAGAINSCPTTNPCTCRVSPRSLAYVTYAADSVHGRLGIMVEHRNVSRCLAALDECLHFGRMDNWISMHSVAHHCSMLELWAPLVHGGQLTIASEEAALAPDEFRAVVEGEKITTAVMTSDELRRLVSSQASGTKKQLLQLIVVIDDFARCGRVDGMGESAREYWPKIVHVFGMSETTSFAAHELLRRSAADHVARGRRSYILPHSRVYVLDEYRQSVPVGALGEIYVGGVGVAHGYIHRPDVTAERFLPDPFAGYPDAIMFRTRKFGRQRCDGSLEWAPRACP